ncbi:hypothetical protein AYO21_09838 [Fonsecaea monophora]|uniref:FAD/NAD(P)-binding domain-containing protein n=1 Tax=Fonsecaea monophora TaxID=254056 RepID=A0A177EVK1_9EURO|nr:hypothetical protein AYO21_09838 [Fonsecaea monophora]OAG35978.1 hypothetical protein AYO21_09838 [Fonsecaea monophora]
MSSKYGYLPSYQAREVEKHEANWRDIPNANRNFTKAEVVIVGGGISGMCMAIDLLVTQRAKNIILLEKGGGFGGTCVLYSYSFAQNPRWSHRYPGQEEILDYLTSVAQKYGLYKYTRFHTTVEAANWNDRCLKWEITVTVGEGKESEFTPTYQITSDFLVAATGQLNNPKGMDTPGYNDYQGKIMHSARWDWSYDLKGKKIAVIGTGATSAQIAPEIARLASEITICQRTPAWVIPRHDEKIPHWQQTLHTYLPPARWRARAEAMDFRESFHSAVTQADSAYADLMRSMNYNLLREQLPNRPDLWDKLSPRYHPGCKRTVISDDYYPTFLRQNVKLETDKIERFTRDGIKFQGHDSAEKFDLIVMATGFDTFSFLSPIGITGRNRRRLEDIWAKATYAYKGVTVPDLPNFGMLYGPNTNLSHNSLILVIEAQTKYISVLVNKVLQARRTGGGLALCPSEEKTLSYWLDLQKALQQTSFADPNCNSWWKRADGLITNNWAGTAIDYQKNLATVEWTDYDAFGMGGSEVAMFGTADKATKIRRVVEETRLSRTSLGLLLVGIVGFILQSIAWTAWK